MTDMSHLDPASNVKVLGEGRRDWSILVRGVQQHSDSKKNHAVISGNIIFRVFGTVDGRNPAPVDR